MTLTNEQIQALKSAAEKATALNLDSAQLERGNDGYSECPICCGAGEVEAENDFCNIDGVALGVQFYGIGEHHGAAEAYFRAVPPAVIRSLLAEREADKALIAELEKYAEAEASGADKVAEDSVYWMKRCKELEPRALTVKLPPRAPDNFGAVLDGYEKWLIATTFRDTWNACLSEVTRINAAGITLVVGGEGAANSR